MSLPAENARCTFADVLSWSGNDRCELIGGRVFLMSPPSSRHQEV